MGWRVCVLGAMCVVGCIRAELVYCDDGRVCPVGTVCDTVHASCVTPAQTTACDGLADGDRCDAAGTLGICDRGTCGPGCSDSVHDAGEECDDGNDREHDGCSSTCVLEDPRWTLWQSPWLGRTQHAAARMPGVGIVLFGGADDRGVHGDQWHIRGPDDWSKIGPLGPPPRKHHAMAFDPDRNVIVMFGGLDGVLEPLGDTWEFNGTSWTQRAFATAPPASGFAHMVYDTARARMVLFGGLAGDTWLYNGTSWQKDNGAGPPGRVYHGMAYDSARDLVVIHGGVNAQGPLTDTWEYNGTWSEVTGIAPSVRLGAAMTYSPARGKTVLFGGVILPSDIGNDTWELGAGGWSRVNVGAVTPPARYFASLTAGADGAVRLIGGADGEGRCHTDVWRQEINGTWTTETPYFEPDAREAAMAYDDARGQLLMYGGSTIVARTDSWRFDGTLWRTATAPPMTARHHYGIAYDSQRQRGVLFGGVDQYTTAHNTTLEWDGTQWALVTPTASPPARFLGAMAYDAANGVVVLFGGRVDDVPVDDTWEYDGTTWTQNTTSPHPSPDEYMQLAYDPVNRRIVAYGIEGVTWVYENRTWRSFPGIPSPPLRVGGNLFFHAARGSTMLINGFAESFAFDPTVWELRFDAAGQPTWTSTEVSGVTPPPRFHAAAGYLPNTSTVVLYGGSSSAGPLGDTWLLTYD